MENSSRALIIAGGVLVAVMVLSLWVYVFKKAASIGQSYEAGKQGEQLVAFNSQFESYLGTSRQDASGYFLEKSNRAPDVITCANLISNINKKNDYDEVNNVELEVIISAGEKYHIYSMKSQPNNAFIKGNRTSTSYLNFNDFLKKYSEVKILDINVVGVHQTEQETIYKYYFDVRPTDIQYSDSTGKVNKIIFRKYETTKLF